MRRKSLPIACFLIALSACRPAHAVEIRPLWSVNLFTFIESGARLADIDLDSLDEIVICGREDVIAMDGAGTELWRWKSPGRFMTSPAILARPGSIPLIYAADHLGNLSCIDGAGNLVWQAKLKKGSTWSHPAIADLDADSAAEVLQTDEAGNLWAFDALTGAVKWQTTLNGSPVTPAIAAASPNSAVVVAIATGAGILYLLRPDGSIAWEKTIGGASQSWATPAPVIFSASDGAPRIAAASAEGALLCLDYNGNILWSHPTSGIMASTISVSDIDRDNNPDIFCITQSGVVHRFDETGRLIWQIDMQGRTIAPGTITDVDGDAQFEFVLSTQAGRLIVFNDHGQFSFEHTFDNRTINVTPPFGELDPAVPGRELVITGGESGQVFCFSTAPQSTTGSGPQPRVNPAMTLENTAPAEIATGDPLRFLIEASDTHHPLRAEAVCIRPDGSLQSALLPVTGPSAQLNLPVDFNLAGDYRIQWFLKTTAGICVFSGQSDMTIDPVANDRTIMDRTLQKLTDTAEKIGPTMPLTRNALLDERTRLKAKADDVNAARRSADIADLAVKALDAATPVSLVAFEDTVWESRDIDSRVPQSVQNPLTISRRAVPGEHEPVAVNLFNLLDRELRVRCIVDPAPLGISVTILHAQPSPTPQGDLSWDALPELDESGIISIPPLSTRQVWLDIDAASPAPGDHNVKLRLLPIDGPGMLGPPSNPHDVPPPQTSVEIALNVLPFAMAPSNTMRLCAWATLGEAEIADQLAHGANVFCGSLPQPQYDARGAYAGADYDALDKLVASTQGNDVVLLLQGMPQFPEPREANATRYFDDLAAFLAQRGVDEKHFALYPIDEPSIYGWNGVNEFIQFAKTVRAARPTIQIYADGGGELPMFQAMDPVLDIWCVGINMLMENTPEMKFVRSTPDTLWSYNCSYSHTSSAQSSIKNTNIFAEFRTAALYALRWNATGIGFWCYNIGADPWTRTELDFPLVYPGRTKPVTSRRWEAVREGIEDARILAALRNIMNHTADQNLKTQLSQLLDAALPNLIDPSWKHMRLGLNRKAIDDAGNDQILSSFRTQMLDCVQATLNVSPTP